MDDLTQAQHKAAANLYQRRRRAAGRRRRGGSGQPGRGGDLGAAGAERGRRRATSSTRKSSTTSRDGQAVWGPDAAARPRRVVRSRPPAECTVMDFYILFGGRARRDAERHQARVQATRAQVHPDINPGDRMAAAAVPADCPSLRNAERSSAAPSLRRGRRSIEPPNAPPSDSKASTFRSASAVLRAQLR